MKYIFSLISIIIIVLIHSCGLSKGIGRGIEPGFRPMTISSVAMTKFLVESSSSIFRNDSILQEQSILINYLKASFITHADTFDLHIDSIAVFNNNDTIITFKKVIVKKGEITFHELDVPYLADVFLPDTMSVKVVCEYIPHMDFSNTDWKYLRSNYKIEKNAIKLQNKFFK